MMPLEIKPCSKVVQQTVQKAARSRAGKISGAKLCQFLYCPAHSKFWPAFPKGNLAFSAHIPLCPKGQSFQFEV